ncbi:serine/threonine-protein kinase [Methanoplanus limicola]|uniref:Serine/threonine protein kinase n=1 Tax=Methanoplanus limicola DSM 2279 TaxID=937775 RepID=H1YZ12_9EURY|nr:serine/threonine-protein kinase [Methanoplanus limicola]EHQ34241.1 serine/threonine protein kinase [Methanoplanus limicola DSM 2279]
MDPDKNKKSNKIILILLVISLVLLLNPVCAEKNESSPLIADHSPDNDQLNISLYLEQSGGNEAINSYKDRINEILDSDNRLETDYAKEENQSVNLSATDTAEEYTDRYTVRFFSNIYFILILFISAWIVFLAHIAGKESSERYIYNKKPFLTAFLIPAYTIQGLYLFFITITMTSGLGLEEIGGTGPLENFFLSWIYLSLSLGYIYMAYSIIEKKNGIFVWYLTMILTLILLSATLIIIYPDSELQIYTTVAAGITSLLINTSYFAMIKRYPSFNPNDTIITGFSDKKYSEYFSDKNLIKDQNTKLSSFPDILKERYMQDEFVGRGGMAKVFKVKRRKDGRTVALKIPIYLDEKTGINLFREMNIWKDLDHKNIIHVFDLNILPVPFVEIEYFKDSLAGMKKPADEKESAAIISGIAEGLSYAHKRGIVHRDIKPQNILLTRDNIPKIADWGLGKHILENTETGTMAFSLHYAAPEQVLPKKFGRCDRRTDIFQLSALYYELITGHLPFSGDGIGEFTAAIIAEVPKPPSYYNPELKKYDAFILKGLEKYPDNRYSSAEEFISSLKVIAESREEMTED